VIRRSCFWSPHRILSQALTLDVFAEMEDPDPHSHDLYFSWPDLVADPFTEEIYFSWGDLVDPEEIYFSWEDIMGDL
jgi:hypothetical protein